MVSKLKIPAARKLILSSYVYRKVQEEALERRLWYASDRVSGIRLASMGKGTLKYQNII
jgi:hypothetical protein